MTRTIVPIGTLRVVSVLAIAIAASVTLAVPFIVSQAVTPIEATQGSPSGVGKTVNINGASVYYEEWGKGLPLVLNPGGRHDVEQVRALAQKLAKKYRVIIWDRSNHGRSDAVFKGARDVDLWSDQLAELLQTIDARPAYLAGPSLGGRMSYVTAIRYPDVVRGLFLYLVSANDGLAETLGKTYYGQHAEVAEKQGMFARVMRRWQRSMRSSDPVVQATECDLRTLNETGIPIRIIAGCADDPTHNLARSQLMARLVPNAEFVEAPGFCQTWAKVRQDPSGRTRFGPWYEVHPMVPQLIDDFITSTEDKRSR